MRTTSSTPASSSAAAKNKRKDPPTTAVQVKTTLAATGPAATVTPKANVSPYEARLEELSALCESNHGYVLWNMQTGDHMVLERIPGKLEELGVDCVEDLDDEEIKKALHKLTQAQVDRYLQYLIAPQGVADLFDRYRKEITYADPRNSPGDGFLMLDTHSSWCMVPVIQKQLMAATKEVNKALKSVSTGATVDARPAFEKTVAAVFACSECDHWRVDTESPEDCEKIAKKVSKLLKDLLVFTDEELGLVDPHSRRALLAHLDEMRKEWRGSCFDFDDKDCCAIADFRTAKNGNGAGRRGDGQAAAPTAKKPKTLAPIAAAAAAAAGNSSEAIVNYLNGIQDKLALRVKTRLQIKIADGADPTKSCRVVLSGATCLKKLGQLIAYLTGRTADFHFHSQKGKSLKGSLFELRLNNGEAVDLNAAAAVGWLGEKALAKKAAAAGAAYVLDKNVKIVQVFQGLILGPSSGMVYDSDAARSVATMPGSFVWLSSADDKNAKRYNVTVEGIVANKCDSSGNQPLPRLVTGESNNSTKVFGKKTVTATNHYLQADRQGPGFIVFRGTSQARLNEMAANCAARPICEENGTVIDRLASVHFEPANINSAGPPTQV